MRILRMAAPGLAPVLLWFLLVPMVLGLLPKPQLSAEAALEARSRISICAPSGSVPAKHAAHDHCLLCPNALLGLAAGDAAQLAAPHLAFHAASLAAVAEITIPARPAGSAGARAPPVLA